MANPLDLDTLRPRLARLLGTPQRWPDRWPAARELALPGGSARVWDAGGAGTPLVWMPDPPVVIEHYAELVGELHSTPFRPILVELPGTGFALPARGFRFDVATMGRSLAALLERLDLRGAVLVGTCLGGYAMQAAASVAPERVAKLVLLQTPSWEDGQSWVAARDPSGLLRRPWLGQVAFQLLARGRMERWFTYAAGDPARAPPLASLARAAFDHGGCFCLPSLFQQYLDPRQVRPRPPSVPTLVVAGLADRSHRTTRWDDVLAAGPEVTLARLEGIGHFPDLEAPAEIVRRVHEFVFGR